MSYSAQPLDPAGAAAAFAERSLAAGLLASGASPAAAPPARWTLTNLLQVALFYSPELDLARARAASAEAALITAGARPYPAIAFSSQDSVNPDPGQSPWTLGLDLDIPLEIAGQRGYRMRRAEALSVGARLDLAAAAWSVRSRLRADLVALVFDRAEWEQLRAEEDSRARLQELLEARVAAGESSPADALPATLEAQRASADRRAAAGRITEDLAALAAALGVPAEAVQDCALEPAMFAALPAESAFAVAALQRAGLLNRLDLRRALADYDAAEATLQLEVSRQYPDLHLGPGYQFDQGQNRLALGAGVTLPLPSLNRGPIAEAEAGRREAAARVELAQFHAFAELDAALARWRAARAESGAAEALAATQQRRLAAARAAVEVGEADRAELLAAEIESAAASRQRLRALRSAQEALGALENAIERPLDPAPSDPWEFPLP